VVVATPTPEPTAAPEVVVPVAPVVLEVLGTWSGRVDGRPFTLAILHQEGAALTGTLRVFSGTGWRTFAVQGRLSGTQLWLGDGGQLEVRATVSGDQLRNGTLRIGRAEQSGWTAAR
jgi:hypothetical protein